VQRIFIDADRAGQVTNCDGVAVHLVRHAEPRHGRDSLRDPCAGQHLSDGHHAPDAWRREQQAQPRAHAR